MSSNTDGIHTAIGVVGVLALLLIVFQSTARASIHLSDGISELVESSARYIDSLTPVEGTPVIVDCENMGPACSVFRSVSHRMYQAVDTLAEFGNVWARPQPNPNDRNESERSLTRPRVGNRCATCKKKISPSQGKPKGTE